MDHHKFSPSSFPMRNKCAQYSSGEPGEAAKRGSMLHDAFASMFGGKLNLFSIPEEDVEELEWAKATVDAMITKDHPVEVEVKLSYTDSRFKEIYFGHGDIVNGPTLFDLKTGEQHAYWHQMAAYALALMDERGYDKVDVHLLYSRFKTLQSYTITRAQAEPAIMDIITRCGDPDAPYTPNQFCGWCEKRPICPALAERVDAITVSNDWQLESYRLADIEKNPTELGKALHLSRLMMKWSYAIQDLAKGKDDIPGFRWKEVRGRRSIKDAIAAFKKAGISQDAFLGACSISMSALEKAFRDDLDISAKDAKALILEKLSDLINESKPYQKLEEDK